MDKKIIDKIKKCLALAGSSNPNEAATALRQAQALMTKYGLTGEDLELSDVEASLVKSGVGKTPPQWIVHLIGLVEHALGVDAIYRAQQVGFTGQWVGKVEFIGTNGAAEIAVYTYDVLLRKLKKGRSEYLKSLNKRLKAATKIRRGDLYSEGWVDSVYRQINKQVISEAALALIDKYKQKNHPDLKTGTGIDRTRKTRQHDEAAFWKGKADGKNVTLNQGVRADKRDALTHQGA